MNLVYPPPPPKFCITIVSHFSWMLQFSQEKSKTMIMQNFKRVNKVHYGLCENGEFFYMYDNECFTLRKQINLIIIGD